MTGDRAHSGLNDGCFQAAQIDGGGHPSRRLAPARIR